jgi:predicted GIY-YIG superfamily endonuclease
MPAGIYKILNTNTNKIYIGSSNDIERRFKEHLYLLKNNKHHSTKLQRSYNKTKDKNVFKFEIIEEVQDESKLKEREQYYIDLYDAFNAGYNCCAESDNLKYTYKNEKKKIKDKNRNEYYNEFIELYNQYNNILIFSNIFLNRLLKKHYKSPVYTTINTMIKWFIDNYGTNYKVEVTAQGNQQYYLVINNEQENRIAFYKYYQGKMYNSKCDTDMCINILKNKGLYNENIHYLIDVPNFKFH